jgi:hypothetical protein
MSATIRPLNFGNLNEHLLSGRSYYHLLDCKGIKYSFKIDGPMFRAIVTIVVTVSALTGGSIFVQIVNSQGSPSVNITTSNSNLTDIAPAKEYEVAREQFLKVWDTLGFHPLVVTYVNESVEMGNGVYQERPNVFSPGEDILLYVQPIGFGHKELQGPNGEKGYLMNFTADIVITLANGTIVGGGQNIRVGAIMSHYRNTEFYFTLSVTQTNPFPKGDYVINYRVIDQISGKDFELSKDITIS